MRCRRVRFVTVACVMGLLLTACGSDDLAGDDEHWIIGNDLPDAPESAAEFAATTEPFPAPTTALAPTPEPVEEPTAIEVVGDGLFPTVIGAEATLSSDESWRVNVTLVSEYDSPERYADAWRVLDADDNELGIRVLAHDHANEQPFTRSTNVDIPADITTVFIEGRDQLNGWSGERYELTLER